MNHFSLFGLPHFLQMELLLFVVSKEKRRRNKFLYLWFPNLKWEMYNSLRFLFNLVVFLIISTFLKMNYKIMLLRLSLTIHYTRLGNFGQSVSHHYFLLFTFKNSLYITFYCYYPYLRYKSMAQKCFISVMGTK